MHVLDSAHPPRLLLIDKPEGPTSYAVVKKVKRYFAAKKVGHAGTLDPLATGLLVLGVNEGTKQLTDLVGKEKTYRTEILLGRSTETSDREGRVLKEKVVHSLDERDIEDAVLQMKGEQVLPVSLYSAIKQDGVPLYKKARRGEMVEPPLRTMKIHTISLLDAYPRDEGTYVIAVQMRVSSGTYVRSIAEEIGRKLDYPAMVWKLRRTSVGEYNVQDAYPLSMFGNDS